MQLIQTQTLTSTQATIEFTSIPQTFDDLCFTISGRHSGTGFPHAGATLTVNGSSANQSQRFLRNMAGIGLESLSESAVLTTPTAINTSNTFSSTNIYIPNYRLAAAKNLSVDDVVDSNDTGTFYWLLRILALRWNDTAAITSLGFTYSSGTFVAGSTISLYGITRGSDGIVTTSP